MRLVGVILTPLPLAAQTAANATLSTACRRSPVSCVEQFYRWYVGVLEASREPLADERPSLAISVTPTRLRALDTAKQRGTLDVDYFLQAQDWLPTWADSVHATRKRQVGATAEVDVVLGHGNDRHPLRATLVRHGARWRVDRVRARSPQ